MASLKGYIEKSYTELVHKVSWPSWKDLQSSSIIVLVAAAIVSLIIFAMDYVFGVQNASDPTAIWKGVLGFIYEFLN